MDLEEKDRMEENNADHEQLSLDQIMADLAESRQQIAEGKVKPMPEALDEIGKKYGFY